MAASEVTQLLKRMGEGEAPAADRLLPLVYDEMRRLAGSFLKQERLDHTLQPTALVHEAYLKLVDQTSASYQSRGHFMAIAATAMRRILVNHAKHHRRIKRGGDRKRVPLPNEMTCAVESEIDLVALDKAMERLAAVAARKVKVVEMQFFVGLTLEETAEVLSISLATVKRDWQFARVWLMRELSDNGQIEG